VLTPAAVASTCIDTLICARLIQVTHQVRIDRRNGSFIGAEHERFQ